MLSLNRTKWPQTKTQMKKRKKVKDQSTLNMMEKRMKEKWVKMIWKGMLKRLKKKNLNQRKERSSCNIHLLNLITRRDKLQRNMPRSKRLKIEYWTSKKKESRLMLSQLVFYMVLVKLSSIIILKRHGSKDQRNFQLLVKVKTVSQQSMWKILHVWSSTSLRIHLRISSTSLVLITLRDQPKENSSKPFQMV